MIVPHVFSGQICAGSNYRHVAESLKKAGFLDHDINRLEKQERIHDYVDDEGNKRDFSRFYVISDRILEY